MALLQKRSALEKQAIATRESDAELAKIRNILPQFFAEHGPQLLMAYLTVQQEYVPLCRALTPQIARIAGQIVEQFIPQPEAEKG